MNLPSRQEGAKKQDSRNLIFAFLLIFNAMLYNSTKAVLAFHNRKVKFRSHIQSDVRLD